MPPSAHNFTDGARPTYEPPRPKTGACHSLRLLLKRSNNQIYSFYGTVFVRAGEVLDDPLASTPRPAQLLMPPTLLLVTAPMIFEED
jgi:hypothetical protein